MDATNTISKIAGHDKEILSKVGHLIDYVQLAYFDDDSMKDLFDTFSKWHGTILIGVKAGKDAESTNDEVKKLYQNKTRCWYDALDSES